MRRLPRSCRGGSLRRYIRILGRCRRRRKRPLSCISWRRLTISRVFIGSIAFWVMIVKSSPFTKRCSVDQRIVLRIKV